MYQVALHRIIQVTPIDNLSIQQRPLTPPYLPTPLLVDQQPAPQLLRLDFQKPSELFEVHGRVELEVGFDGRRVHVGANFGHEDRAVVVYGVDVDLWVLKIGVCRGDELGARRAEELFEEGKRFWSPTLQTNELISILLAQRCVYRIIQLRRTENHTDGNQRVHLVVLLADAVVLRVLLEILRAGDVYEDMAEHTNGICVPPHHHVAETNIIVRCEMRRHHPRKHRFLVQLDIVQSLQRQREVAQQTVHPQ